MLHLTTGLPGVGKTTLARRLEREGNALRFTPDRSISIHALGAAVLWVVILAP